MGSVQVALLGPSAAAVQTRLQEIAGAVEAEVSPFNVIAGFDTDGSTTTHEAISAILAQSLSDDELAARLMAFQDETVNPHEGVRFIVKPENIKDPPVR
jgi:hypothetical protein